ncbi:hypothetical protein AALO_G00046920 [Alosa alosa]|uniref:Uncharacterized protein n=1 Tax=Alosa alosa TaxID=278164 RepID=A0AAV6H3K5_9TELE|nr:hypothetical protein AALO_G00046920 [Alosa alosa]
MNRCQDNLEVALQANSQCSTNRKSLITVHAPTSTLTQLRKFRSWMSDKHPQPMSMIAVGTPLLTQLSRQQPSVRYRPSGKTLPYCIMVM